MLEQYRDLLDQLRRDRGSWSQLDYLSVPDPHRAYFDGNFVRRYGVLICLQCDRRDEDCDLTRYLFEQEVVAREHDTRTGEMCALRLAAFLLAWFRVPSDLPLFWRAKMANFDTWCLLHAEYLLLADRKSGSDLIGRQSEGMRDALSYMLGSAPDAVDQVHLEYWWQEQQRAFPDREEDESPLELSRRSLALGALQEGRRWLDRWEATQPGDQQTLHTVMNLRDALDQPAEALTAAEKLRDFYKDDPRRYAGALLSLPPLQIRLGCYEDAWDVLVELDHLLARNRDWIRQALARMVVEAMLDLAASDKCSDGIRRQAWDRANGLFKRGVKPSLVALEKAERVAGLVGDRALQKRYSQRAARERARIHRELGGG